METSWPLWVVGGVFVLLGLLVAADPEEAREFFARQARFLFGDEAGRRYRAIPSSLFRFVGLVAVMVGFGFGVIAAGGG